MTDDQICVTATSAAPTPTSPTAQFNSTTQGLCHFCYCSNSATMLDLDNTWKSICIPCMIGMIGVRK